MKREEHTKIYDDVKLKKNPLVSLVYTKTFSIAES